MQEIERSRQMAECNYCKMKEIKLQEYENEIERQKQRECLKALEREKIAKGMRCTKQDEINLKEIQKMQMNEKKQIENEERTIESMWHNVLLDDVLRKTQIEEWNERRRQHEMLERRKAYDEQIASANKKRQQAVREEIEKENRRLDKMKQKMEQDHYNDLKRKKQQQMTNKNNFLTSSKIKLSRIRNEKINEREFDNNTIRRALEELRQERDMKMKQIQNMQIEKKICLENYKIQKQAALAIEQETERIVREWKQQEQNKSDEYLTRVEREQKLNKEKAAKEYKEYVENINNDLIKAKIEKHEAMERVKETALRELRDKIHSANSELKKQIEYRNSLTKQIHENQNHLENEQKEMELKDRPFTKGAIMFRNSMERKFKKCQMEPSTNPVHPFRRAMKAKEANSSVQLPLI